MGSPVARKIGLLGGTFNPIHIGHLRSAIEVLEFLALEELRLIPNALPPHRELPHVSADQRLAMVERAAANIPQFVVDDRELARDKPSYTIETLVSIRAELDKEDQLFFIMGWDAFYGLPSWHRWQELLTYCHIIVLQRPQLSAKIPSVLDSFLRTRLIAEGSPFTSANGQVAFLQQAYLDISSTQIRERLTQGKSVQFLLPDSVLDYINQHQLYQKF